MNIENLFLFKIKNNFYKYQIYLFLIYKNLLNQIILKK